MKVYLIRTSDVDLELFTGVVSLLQAIPGAIRFIPDPDFPRYKASIHVSKSVSLMRFEEWHREKKIPPQQPIDTFIPPDEAVQWSLLFNQCEDFRRDHHLSDDDIVILLTDKTNHLNWFSAMDENMPSNGFIHTSDWDLYLQAPAIFPIAYEVISLILQRHIYADMQQLNHLIHENPIGCVNDFCQDKKQIILKMRTADICQPCLEVARQYLPIEVIDHALSLMESLRLKMLYAQNFRQSIKPSRLVIDRNQQISLPDFGHTMVPLTPLEVTLYIFFLRHPEGVMLTMLANYRDELNTIYGALCINGGRNEIKSRIDALTNITTNSASEKISKIKNAFIRALGPGLAQHYYIQGQKGGDRFITLDRSLVEFQTKI